MHTTKEILLTYRKEKGRVKSRDYAIRKRELERLLLSCRNAIDFVWIELELVKSVML